MQTTNNTINSSKRYYMGKMNQGLANYLANKKKTAGKTVIKGNKIEAKFPDSKFPQKGKKPIKKNKK